MKVLETGHIYQPAMRRAEKGAPLDSQTLTFINKQPGQEHDGATMQEVIHILIDRTRHCANCMPHPNNERIVYYLRMALTLHEARALERKVEKGNIQPEYIATGSDGHFELEGFDAGELDTTHLIQHRHDWDRVCNHPENPKSTPTLVQSKRKEM